MFKNNTRSRTKKSMMGKNQLYLLCWHDAIDRIDTLLLEARHLQLNIIHNLREPGLLLALRYEEKYLWNFLSIDSQDQEYKFYDKDDKYLSELWICPYPNPSSKEDKKDKEDIFNRLCKKLCKLVDDAWNSGSWGTSQRHNYDILRAVQLFKQELFCDKLMLCRYAINEAKLYIPERNSDNGLGDLYRNYRPEFMILRSCIMNKLAELYIPRLTDYQQSLANYIDLDSKDLPHSSLTRRKEIGPYSDFLYERTLDEHASMGLLLQHLGIENILDNSPLIIHRWQFSHSSYARGYGITKEESHTNQKKSPTYHLNTHYWMPERPDLQPIISHEVAHIFLKLHLNNFEEGYFYEDKNPFSRTLLRIQETLEDFLTHANNDQLHIHFDSAYMIREMACDFLAVSQKGMPYIYAYFIEFLGFHKSFKGITIRDSSDELTNKLLLDSIKFASSDIFGSSEYDNRDWYLRTRVLCKWMREINDKGLSPLDEELLYGMEEIIEDIQCYYQNIAATEEQFKRERFWYELTNSVIRIIKRDRKLTNRIKKWICNKNNDYHKAKTGKKGRRNMPRSFSRLDNKVRDFLFYHQLWMKRQDGRPLNDKVLGMVLKDNNENKLDIIINYFNKYYLHCEDNEKYVHNFTYKDKNINPDKGILYRHIFDIPWQSALMRAKDILYKFDVDNEKAVEIKSQDRNTVKKCLEQLHYEFPLGKDLFALALEFHLFNSYSPRERLATAKHLLSHCPKLDNKIDKWLDIEKKYNSGVCSIMQRFKKHSYGTELYVDLEKESEKKLKELFEIIEANKGLQKDLLPMKSLLGIRSGSKALHEFYDIILGGFYIGIGDVNDTTECKWKCLKNRMEGIIEKQRKAIKFNQPYLLSRISLSGSYATVTSRNNDNVMSFLYNNPYDNENNKPLVNEDAYSLPIHWKSRTRPSVLKDGGDIKGESDWNYSFYSTILGHNDAWVIKPSISPCRCILPDLSRKYYKNNKYDEHSESIVLKECFPSFYVRREMGIPFRLGLGDWNPDFEKYPPLAGMLVQLKQRSDRLGFLYRIRKSSIEKNKFSSDFLEGVAANEFNTDDNYNSDCAFLLDGANDILLLFRFDKTNKAKIRSRLDQIHTIHRAIYQDFTVNRTELVYTPDVLNVLKDDANKGKDGANKGTASEKRYNYNVAVRIRLMEDRWLEKGITIYINKLKQRYKKYHRDGEKIKCREQSGQFDLSFWLGGDDDSSKDNADKENIDIYRYINDLVCHDYLDQAETLLLREKIKTVKKTED